jgi:uncharacterized SAM-binding protein YcdF (DUF218 family)
MDILLLKSILIPSSICFFLFLFGFLYISFDNQKKRKKGYYILLVAIFLYYLFSITPGADFFISFLEADFEELSIERIEEANIIVVLTGGEKTDLIRSSEVLRISNLKDNQVQLIISGTETLSGRGKISAIENFFISRGVPADNIIVDDNSRNTKENAKEVVKIIEKEPFFLVTSAYHMQRAINEFKEREANPIPAPVDFRNKNFNYELEDYIPNSNNLRKTDLAFYEYLGIIYYRLFD